MASSQRDLTRIQKLFLFHAYPIFNEKVKEDGGNQDNGGATTTEREAFKKRYKEAQEKNRAKLKNRKK